MRRERGLRGTRRLKMGFNSVERMLRNVVHRMKSENYNGFHASAVMVLQIVLERSLEIKQAYLKWTMVEFRGVDLCTERDQMQCEMLDCRGGHDATEAKSQKLAGTTMLPGTMPPKLAGAGTMPPQQRANSLQGRARCHRARCHRSLQGRARFHRT